MRERSTGISATCLVLVKYKGVLGVEPWIGKVEVGDATPRRNPDTFTFLYITNHNELQDW